MKSFFKNKTVLGVIFTFVFIFSILGLASISSPNAINVKYVKNVLGKWWPFKTSQYSVDKTFVNQKVVQEESSVIDVVDKVSPAVVSIVIKSIDFDFYSGPVSQEQGIGTGFIVDSSGLIVTNSHVVDNSDGEYKVVLKDGTTYDVSKIHLDESTDLAVLEIVARGLPTAELGDSDSLKVGQRAIAIGNALGRYQNTVTVGVVSGVARQLQASGVYGDYKTYENAIQTDAAINPGNSGGPLLNSSGQVIGVNVATALGANSISFAIPVNTLKPIVETFIKEGRIVKPYIGVQYTLVTKEIANIQKLPQGAFVSGVISGSPADDAGIRRGDIITKLGDKSLGDTQSLASLIQQKKVGDKVTLTLDRNGKEMTVEVELEEMPARR